MLTKRLTRCCAVIFMTGVAMSPVLEAHPAAAQTDSTYFYRYLLGALSNFQTGCFGPCACEDAAIRHNTHKFARNLESDFIKAVLLLGSTWRGTVLEHESRFCLGCFPAYFHVMKRERQGPNRRPASLFGYAKI